MHQLSIRARLNVLIGALLLLALATNVIVIIWSAGPRIRAENDSILKLTRQTVDQALVDLQSSVDPARDIAALLDRLANVRHARVHFLPTGADISAYRTTDGRTVPLVDRIKFAPMTVRSRANKAQ